ncbi:hypothetical protein RN001_009711 [Aquatica leii]|uniref:Uncharacterized protein n=1 Tax=Aquatica leii TaxID=1421715 RepID=A0AAN7Q2N8_9COLE|nr:hypothetical protein RN001_009711 [Aquatica leii]
MLISCKVLINIRLGALTYYGYEPEKSDTIGMRVDCTIDRQIMVGLVMNTKHLFILMFTVKKVKCSLLLVLLEKILRNPSEHSTMEVEYSDSTSLPKQITWMTNILE